PKYTIASIAIAFAGALLVITNGKLSFFQTLGQYIFPLVLMLIAVIGWVVYSMGGSRLEGWSVLRYSTLTCIFGSTSSLIVVVTAASLNLLEVPQLQTLVAIKYEMAFMILLPGIVALLCWNAGIK